MHQRCLRQDSEKVPATKCKPQGNEIQMGTRMKIIDYGVRSSCILTVLPELHKSYIIDYLPLE